MNRKRIRDTSVPESIEELFLQSRSSVSRDDIVAFAPVDPGYDDYVWLWSEIQRTGSIPTELSFDLREVIGMAGWCVAARWGDKVRRFIAYRRFTSAVALMLVHQGHDVDDVRPANFLARDLLVDLVDFPPSVGVSCPLLRNALRETRTLLQSKRESQFPFFTLGSMILAQLENDWTSAYQAAEQLIVDEQEARSFLGVFSLPTEFLFGLTVYDLCKNDWHRMIAGLRNPNHHGDTAMILEALRQT